MDAGMLTDAIYADMSKAFDTVGHAGIINKLPDYDITGMPQEWIINYLSNRSQQVTFQNTLDQSQLFVVFPTDQYWDHCYLFYTLMTQLQLFIKLKS